MLPTNIALAILACLVTGAAPASGASIDTRGVHPAQISLYTRNATHFHCLAEPDFVVLASAVNDDYCDCPDGSDEPGTSACEGRGGSFWCSNTGHIGAALPAGRVNDGICDYDECCDGSDEWASGACPDKCAEVGKAWKDKVELERKTRKTGAKIRGTYVKWAQSEKTRLRGEIERKESEIRTKEAEVESAQAHLAGVEAKSQEALEQRKLSPLYTTLVNQRTLLKRLRAHHSTLEDELRELKAILDDLTKGYNPNYQDMAVKAAVSGYEELYRVPVADTPNIDADMDKSAITKAEPVPAWELDMAEGKDLEGLLLQDLQTESAQSDSGLLYRIDEYIPDLFFEHWDNFRESLIDWLIKLGLIGKGSAARSTDDAPYVTAARKAHTDAQNALSRLQNDLAHDAREVEKLSGYEYGRDGEWKKLDGTCVDMVHGDYTYELCFFGRATQKSNKDYSNNHLGTFSEWNFGKEAGTFEYYTKQNYPNGARCWNGPMRSVNVDLSCGTTNALIQVSEPEKCEYRFKVTTPAMCWPLDDPTMPERNGSGADDADGSKDEL